MVGVLFSKTGTTCTTEFSTVGIRKPNIQISETFENRTFLTSVFEWSKMSGFRMVWPKNVRFSKGLGKKRSVFECHSKIGPFAVRSTFNHSKSGHVRFLDPHCI